MKFITRLIKRPPSIVAIGGGTGMASLLRGLKEYTDKILAVVTVADDGGSSGRLRKDFDILPPGDIRNCLVALSDLSPVLEELFQYRFSESDLKGHSFGNILLAALTRITGNFYDAVDEANRILNVKGRVLPATLTKVALVAHHSDGTKSTGESLIGRGTGKRIERISLKPEPDPASPEIIEAIENADLIVLGPGSLYTSVIPNLLIGGMLPAIADSNATKAYICNIMTQPGETGGYSASDHVDALLRHATPNMFDFMIFNDGEISEKMRLKYSQRNSTPVEIDEERLAQLGSTFRIVKSDLVNADNVVRHDSAKIAEALLTTYDEITRERTKSQKTSP